MAQGRHVVRQRRPLTVVIAPRLPLFAFAAGGLLGSAPNIGSLVRSCMPSALGSAAFAIRRVAALQVSGKARCAEHSFVPKLAGSVLSRTRLP